jgi:serine/threonine-protein kinase
VGSTFGQYRIVRRIGCGGMGAVYEAEHEVIGNRAAAKVMLSPAAPYLPYLIDPQQSRRFLNEARALSRVRHAGLVQIFDIGRTNEGIPYLLMEFLDGETLRARMERGRIDLAVAVRLIRQVASALGAAHAAGIVHRDIKPENLMLIEDPAVEGALRVKVLDFGIARFLDENLTQTGPGRVLGTALYMSPEQCLGEPVGVACDVYSLGVVLYELLTGVPPFDGDRDALMNAHVFQEPPVCSGVPGHLLWLARAMLAKAPAARPGLETVLEELTVEPRPISLTRTQDLLGDQAKVALPVPPAEPPARRPPRFRLVAAGLVAAALIVLIAGGAGAIMRAVRGNVLARPHLDINMAKLVWLKGGAFKLGRSPEAIDAEARRLGSEFSRAMLERQQPEHEVVLSPFYIDRFEVTNGELAAWLATASPWLEMRDDPELHKPRYVFDRRTGQLLLDLFPGRTGLRYPGKFPLEVVPGAGDRPVVQITWDAAQSYCRSRGMRLPTEAEWEFAARGTTARRYPWGDEEPHCARVVFGRADDKECAGLPNGPQPVGTAAQDRTPEGVFDLGGNVAEWVFDQFQRPYYAACGSCVDPKYEEPVPPTDDFRIVRGAGFESSRGVALSSNRGRWKRTEVMSGLGFRCATH